LKAEEMSQNSFNALYLCYSLSILYCSIFYHTPFVVLAMTSAPSAGAVEDYEDFLFDT
jgi:hypothetical protein